MSDTQLVDIFAEWQWLTDVALVYEEEALAIVYDRPVDAVDHYIRSIDLRNQADDLIDTPVAIAPGKTVKARLLFTPELAEQAAHAWFDRVMGIATDLPS